MKIIGFVDEVKMNRFGLTLLTLFTAGAGMVLPNQEIPTAGKTVKPEPVFVRLTFYPTASLSRYDYNNDLDLFEIRAYAELRRGSQEGEIIGDAQISVLGELLAFKNGQYEKRIGVEKEKLPENLPVKISQDGTVLLEQEFPLPDWLILTEPRPAVIEPETDLKIRWKFRRYAAPVDILIYDFRRGNSVAKAHELSQQEMTIPAERIPASTILRIYVLPSWLSKRFLQGENLARGSEIIVIPWSQVFIRTEKKIEESRR